MDELEFYDGQFSGPEIDALLSEAQTGLPAVESSIAIVANGNTAPQNIPANYYVYVKNHSTLAEGLYYNKSGSTIASGTTLTSTNLGAVSNGGLNALKSAVTKQAVTITPNTGITIANQALYKIAGFILGTFTIVFSSSQSANTWIQVGTLSETLSSNVSAVAVNENNEHPVGVVSFDTHNNISLYLQTDMRVLDW